MVFEVRDYYDFVRLLHEHPEWQEELRRLVLTRKILELPEIVRELAEAQKRTEQRVEELAEAQKQLAEAQKRTEEKLGVLTKRVDKLSGEVRNLRGDMLEIRYRQRAFGFFGRIVSRVRVVDWQEIWSELEQRLTEPELEDLLSLDILLSRHLKAGWAAQAGVSGGGSLGGGGRGRRPACLAAC
ncbi:MAG: hypothetical protein N2049_01640 [Anaerolineales bacterium]|nr:hypothetical protein [Anaerolineales bacterium]